MDHVIEMELGHNFLFFVKISSYVLSISLTGTDEAESCVECPEALEGRFCLLFCMISFVFFASFLLCFSCTLRFRDSQSTCVCLVICICIFFVLDTACVIFAL